MPVIAIGSLKTAGSTTLALTLASVAAAAGVPVLLVDASRDRDLSVWAAKPGRPDGLDVVSPETGGQLQQAIRAGRDAGALILLDAGSKPEILRFSRRVADFLLIPVRFSPLSTFAAVATDRLVAPETPAETDLPRAFVASAITQIPSRIARIVEGSLALRQTERLAAGLCQRAAYEAPFLYGGTIFTLVDEQAPGLRRAQAEAIDLMAQLTARIGAAEMAPIPASLKPAAMPVPAQPAAVLELA
ncbi:chromosome partitioning protein ParA [Aurantimonas sp. Leaf443]|uniref:chromosome partitioning protein ParA n=1 Tax=Aurantimonas sp. Leaf443 TaxID=1736378 RepID=UPI000AEB66B9|nr:chromosome partitioning protein ParA [Aurantimonas sp. Leaf443]